MNPVNPFALGGVVTGRQFAGRAAEVARLRQLTAAGQHAYLFAPRRYGKTSLLREGLQPEAEAGRLILLWCDCLPTTRSADLATRLAESAVHAVRRRAVTDWAKAAARLFTRLRPSIIVGAGGDVRVSVEIAPAGPERDPELEDALEAAARLAQVERKSVAVVFDEFQQVSSWDRYHRVEAVIRTVIQHQRGVAYFFAGSQRHLLQPMFGDRGRPLFKLAAPFPLDRLARDEVLPWLREQFQDTGFTLEPQAADAIIGVTEGHPWATQYLAHFTWETAGASTERAVTRETVQEALVRAVNAGDTVYAGDFASLTPAQRRVLTAIATEPTSSPTAIAYLTRHQLPAKSTVAQALASLTEKGYLEPYEGTHLMADPLFREWIKRT